MPFSAKATLILLYLSSGVFIALGALTMFVVESRSSTAVSQLIAGMAFFWVASALKRRDAQSFRIGLIGTGGLPLFWIWKAYDQYFYDLPILEAFNHYPKLWIYLIPLVALFFLLFPASKNYFKPQYDVSTEEQS
ncbi:hypothetical protein L2729_05870 [Shewanella gelidimarina]|uniref:hypothetical protein n=1 Tax=Shewanella gelidimarina TaxID=56813 RepID=UPI00200BF8F2|nr:hypothetical protein [Shewanella gelidimarina]MCL1057524.1 hypothetical protein [Shewanella gelidimarina]